MSALPGGGALLLGLYAALALVAATHALLSKKDSRSAWGWIAVCWLFPLAGALLYYLFGVDRIHRRARRYLGSNSPIPSVAPADRVPILHGVVAEDLRELARLGQAMAGRPLVADNSVEPLANGDEAYPAMLDAIRQAKRSVELTSYLFESHGVGLEFITALADAQGRGVQVRVIVDGLADLYYWPRASTLLERRGVAVARFLPPRWLPPMLHINLRNHRKLLIADGATAFLGGINIGNHHVLRRWRQDGIADLHFRVRGPVLEQLSLAFHEDWAYATGQRLAAVAGPEQVPAGTASCRVVTDGPNDEVDRLVLILLGALAAAHRHVRIQTPYFLPPPELVGAMQSAAMRGVDVRVLIPETSDQPWVGWATRRGIAPLLQHQVGIRLQPRPFAHTKLFIVDDYYAQVGSPNLDPRSLQLNFELMLEIYGRDPVCGLAERFDRDWERATQLQLEDLARASVASRLRDSFFWLFSPYF